LPRHADNTYGGYKLGLWVFALVVLLEVGVTLYFIFNGYVVASSGDGIPVGTSTSAGAQTVVSLYALWGIVHLIICLLCVLVLVRYRSLIPLMLMALLLEHLGRKLALHFLPLAATGAGGKIAGLSPTPYGFLALIVLGLTLSLRRRAPSP
jgi:hypothetical protein